MVICELCSTGFGRTKPHIFCDGCKKQFHTNCISKQFDILAALNAVPGLSWRCNDCQKDCIFVNQTGIMELVERKLDKTLSEMKTRLESSSVIQLPQNIEIPRYSDVVKNKTEPAVLIVPKNTDQNISQTKAEVLSKINPLEKNLHLKKVAGTKDGGLVVGCHNEEENQLFVSLVREELSELYDVKEIRGINPRVRISGMTERHNDEQIKRFLTLCNSYIFSDKSYVKIIKTDIHKKNSNLYQSVIELDRISYNKVLKAKHVIIGYDSCAVFDAVDIYRCYNCNEFHHSASKCNNKLSCPICSEDHELKECKSNTHKCSNCVKFNLKANSNVSINHTVFDKVKCSSYKHAKSKLLKDFSISQ